MQFAQGRELEDGSSVNTDDFFVMRFYVKEYLARNGSLSAVRRESRFAKIKMLISFFFGYLIVFRLMLDGWAWTVSGAVLASCTFTALIWGCAAFSMRANLDRSCSAKESSDWVWKSLPIEYMAVADWGGNVKGCDVAEAKGVLYEKRVLDYVGAAYPSALGFVVVCMVVVVLAQS